MACVVYGLYIVCLSCVIAAEHGRYGSMEYCGANKAEYLVHLVRMNRLSACREMCIVGNMNGTRCRDGVKVLWCHSHLVWLVFRVPSLHALVFIQKTFCDLFLLFFCLLYCCLEMVREKRGGRGGQGEDAWSMKYDNIHIKASSKSKHHTFFIYTGVLKFEQSLKPHKTQVQSTRV